MAARNSRGTQIWFYDPTLNGETPIGLTKLICPTGFTVTSGTRETVETAPCLESGEKKVFSGSLTPGTASSPLNFDPQETSHSQLYSLFKSGVEVDFALGFSGSDAAPTYTNNAWTLGTGRDWLTFKATISSVPFEFDPTAAVVSGVEIQLVSVPNLVKAST
jgi:hypothetical protein